MAYGVSYLDIARAAMAIADVGADLGIEVVSQFAYHRYVELLGRCRLRQIREVSTLNYPQPHTEGTVTVTLGSLIVTGNTSGPNQTFWSRQNVGWWFRFATNWYQVADVDPVAQTLRLQTPYAETTVSTPTNTYFLVSRYLKLDKDVRWIGEIVHPRLFRRLIPRTLDWFDKRHPSRIVVAAIPTFWAEGPHYRGEMAGVMDERKQVEVYPSSTQEEMFQYTHWDVKPYADPTDTLPPEVDTYAIREGVLIDMYRRAQMELARKGSQANFGPLITAQYAIWNRAIAALVMADKGQEDDEVELWSTYESGMESDISSEYDRYASTLGIITVQ